MSFNESVIRQTSRDLEYSVACAEHSITPEAPRYNGFHGDGADGALDARILHDPSTLDTPEQSDHRFFDDDEPEEADPISPATREAFGKLLVLIGSVSPDPVAFVRQAGMKILCLDWLLERGPHAGKSLAAIAEKVGCSRACLSAIVRRLEISTGIHARGQKNVSAVESYRSARNKVVASQRAA